MIIKYIPEDFIVQEVLVTDETPEFDNQDYMLLLLRKKGYSTFDALKEIEAWFGFSSGGYAGQKDSDGVTAQKISVPAAAVSCLSDLERFNREAAGEKSWLHLSFLGYSSEALQTARLEGNVFRLCLRGMDPGRAERWFDRKLYTLVFPNYYDKQRFGMPGSKKVTHLIGKALRRGDYRKAYEYVLECGSREASLPFDGDYEAFFRQIDPRVLSFYDSALFSQEFNDRLGRILEKEGPVRRVEDEGISFLMPEKKKTMSALMAEEFPEDRLGSFSSQTSAQFVPRKLLVTTNVNFLSCGEDVYHPGKAALTVSFFLPMGAYATMAMKQLDIFLE